MIPVVIASKNRPELLKQTVQSAMFNTDLDIQVIIIDDASDNPATIEYLEGLIAMNDTPHLRVMMMPDAKGCGAAKNAGAAIAAKSEYIYFSDNDIYFHKHWLEDMIAVMEAHTDIGILGGDRHPHHGMTNMTPLYIESDQQVGFSMLLRQKVWRKIGAFTHGRPDQFGVEDTDLCNKAREHGYKVAAISDRVLTHCGLTNSLGGQAAGYPDFLAQEVPEGVIRI